MSKEIALSQGNKKEKYEGLLPQLISLVEGESDATANLANISAGNVSRKNGNIFYK